jgi:hypothetical protein
VTPFFEPKVGGAWVFFEPEVGGAWVFFGPEVEVGGAWVFAVRMTNCSMHACCVPRPPLRLSSVEGFYSLSLSL